MSASSLTTPNSTQDRVGLKHEAPESCATQYYTAQLDCAAESLLSPLGWDRLDIRQALDRYETLEVTMFDGAQTKCSTIFLVGSPAL
jgi:DNA polymerase I